MGPGTQQGKPELVSAAPHLVEPGSEIGLDPGDVITDIGIDLDGRLEQLLLEPVNLSKRVENLRCRRGERPAFSLNQLELHLDSDC